MSNFHREEVLSWSEEQENNRRQAELAARAVELRERPVCAGRRGFATGVPYYKHPEVKLSGEPFNRTPHHGSLRLDSQLRYQYLEGLRQLGEAEGF